MNKEIKKETTIEIKVGLDENQIPIKINWTASDGGGAGVCKAFILTLWDENEENTMNIDLWNKDMSIYEMQRFFHQTLITMSDTYERATGENETAKEIKNFAKTFADKTGILG